MNVTEGIVGKVVRRALEAESIKTVTALQLTHHAMNVVLGASVGLRLALHPDLDFWQELMNRRDYVIRGTNELLKIVRYLLAHSTPLVPRLTGLWKPPRMSMWSWLIRAEIPVVKLVLGEFGERVSFRDGSGHTIWTAAAFDSVSASEQVLGFLFGELFQSEVARRNGISDFCPELLTAYLKSTETGYTHEVYSLEAVLDSDKVAGVWPPELFADLDCTKYLHEVNCEGFLDLLLDRGDLLYQNGFDNLVVQAALFTAPFRTTSGRRLFKASPPVVEKISQHFLTTCAARGIDPVSFSFSPNEQYDLTVPRLFCAAVLSESAQYHVSPTCSRLTSLLS